MSVVVVGNPKPNSRTRAAAELVAHKLTGSPADSVIEVIELGPGLLGWGDPAVASAKEVVKSTDLLIVASPTFKATYTRPAQIVPRPIRRGVSCGASPEFH